MSPGNFGRVVIVALLLPSLPGGADFAQEAPGEYDEFRIEVDSGTKPAQGEWKWKAAVRACAKPEYIGKDDETTPAVTKGDLDYLRDRLNLEPNLDRIRAIGDAVRATILGPKLEPMLASCFAEAQNNHGRGLRLVVVLKQGVVPPDTVGPIEVPVEALRVLSIPNLEEFPATDTRFLVVRSLDQQPVEPTPVKSPVRMLVIAASPTDQVGSASVKESIDAICRALRGLAFDDQCQSLPSGPVKVTLCKGVTRRRFEDLMNREGPWDIVHFVGHGAFPSEGDEDPTPRAQLLFQREDGTSDRVGALEFATALKIGHPRLVVLTACSSAAPRPAEGASLRSRALANPFDGVAQHLLRTNVTSVVAMQFDFEVKAAELFSREFYDSLIRWQQNDDVAVARCRNALAFDSDFGHGIWITPALYSRSRGGRIFQYLDHLELGGMVLDGTTLQPLPGVSLTVRGILGADGRIPVAVTDAQGQFRFGDLQPSEARQVDLVAEKEGYQLERSRPTLGNPMQYLKLRRIRPGGGP